MTISPLIHWCVVRDGPSAGNKVHTDVTRWNYDDDCEHCGQKLATIEDIVLHVYDNLTDVDKS